MQRFRQIFKKKLNIIGMIHVGALPGTPLNQNSIYELTKLACQDAETYKNSCIDGVLIENMHDLPYVRSNDFGPETVACMTRVCSEVRSIIHQTIPCGVQDSGWQYHNFWGSWKADRVIPVMVCMKEMREARGDVRIFIFSRRGVHTLTNGVLAGGNKEALAVALAAGLQFIRSEGFIFSHIADEGFIDASAGPLLRFRRNIGADHIAVFSDIKKKHSSHAITADLTISETAKAAEFCLSDGIIITGSSTGSPAEENELKDVKASSNLPIIVGSGVTESNFNKYLMADAFIIGTHFKKDGIWQHPVDNDRVKRFMDKVRQ